MKKELRGFLFSLLALTPAGLWAQGAQDYRDMGQALAQKGLYAKAISYFQQAVQADPTDWQSYQSMGDAYLKMNDNSNALASYQKSLQINPNNQAAQDEVNSLGGTTSAPPNPPSQSTTSTPPNAPSGFEESQPTTIIETQPAYGRPRRRPRPQPMSYNDGLAPMDHAKVWTQLAIGYAYSQSSDLNTSASSWNTDAQNFGWGGSALASNDGLNLGFELGFLLNPNSGLALGLKYTNISDYKLGIDFRDGPVTDTTSGNVYNDDYDQTTLSPYIVPLTLDYYLFLPDHGGRFWLSAGGGYYFGVVHVERNYQSSSASGGVTTVSADNYSGDLTSGSFGFQAGIGRDFAVSRNMSISLFARGRYAKLTNFQGNITSNVTGNYFNGGLATESGITNFDANPAVFVEDVTQIGPGNGNRYATIDFTGFDVGVALNFYSF